MIIHCRCDRGSEQPLFLEQKLTQCRHRNSQFTSDDRREELRTRSSVTDHAGMQHLQSTDARFDRTSFEPSEALLRPEQVVGCSRTSDLLHRTEHSQSGR